MKTIILSVIALCLMIGAQSVYAAELKDAPFSKLPTADLLSGLEHGKADVKDGCNHPDGCHWWILMRGDGFINQTQEFIKGRKFASVGDIAASRDTLHRWGEANAIPSACHRCISYTAVVVDTSETGQQVMSATKRR